MLLLHHQHMSQQSAWSVLLPFISQGGMFSVTLCRHCVCQPTVTLSLVQLNSHNWHPFIYSMVWPLVALPQAQTSSLTVKKKLLERTTAHHCSWQTARYNWHFSLLSAPASWRKRKGWDTASPVWLTATQSNWQMLHTETTKCLIPWCLWLCAMRILIRKTEKKTQKTEIELMVSGLAAATFHDPDASRHRSDQGHCATDVYPGALFQAWVLLAHTPKSREKKERTGWAHRKRMDGMKKERRDKKTETGVGEDKESSPEEITRLTTLQAGRYLLCHVSVWQQPVWSECDTVSLDIPQVVTLTLTDLGDE